MYLFNFNKFVGHDRVYYTSLSLGNPGDLIQCGSDFLLNLGENVAFPELIKASFVPTNSWNIIYKGFFNNQFLELLHWMVYWRYSTYNNVLKLFVSFDISALLARESKIKIQKKLKLAGEYNISLQEKKQNLIIIPDNRSRINQLSDSFFKDNVTHLYSIDTQNRKDQHRREIKKSETGIIVATQSEVFQPFNNLGSITLIDGYKRYYHNQQDPRYDVPSVVKKMQEIWNCDVENIDYVGLIS